MYKIKPKNVNTQGYPEITTNGLLTFVTSQSSDVNRIFVDGGFSNNTVYMHLLAIAFPNLEVYAASVAQATAMGAA